MGAFKYFWPRPTSSEKTSTPTGRTQRLLATKSFLQRTLIKKIIGVQPDYGEQDRNDSDEGDHPDPGQFPCSHPNDDIWDRALLGWRGGIARGRFSVRHGGPNIYFGAVVRGAWMLGILDQSCYLKQVVLVIPLNNLVNVAIQSARNQDIWQPALSASRSITIKTSNSILLAQTPFFLSCSPMDKRQRHIFLYRRWILLLW